MKFQRHKRKESFSILLISNTDRHSRQFQISLLSIRLILLLLLLLCIAAGWLIYRVSTGYREKNTLHSQLVSQKELTKKLQAENKELRQTNEQLKTAQIQEKTKTKEDTPSTKDAQNMEPEKDTSFPSRYPTQGSSILQSTYSPEHPSLTINAHAGCNFIAAADGTVTSVSSDTVYKYIIDIQHEGGYTTRYLCSQEAELKIAEGTQVHAGDILLTVTIENTVLDYQIIFGGAPIDPFTLIDAKG
ncbi:MAG: peptidoglycan DD-metalloendopeptidase family protein [Lachnospiraceae bacterium]|nr:peptidoglycan DD-metalloendopeptidase family protein [Lachnospiraceae bacterium]